MQINSQFYFLLQIFSASLDRWQPGIRKLLTLHVCDMLSCIHELMQVHPPVSQAYCS